MGLKKLIKEPVKKVNPDEPPGFKAYALMFFIVTIIVVTIILQLTN